jgi:tripeptidyl-peptidase-1
MSDFITPTIHFDAKVKRGVQPGIEQYSKRDVPGSATDLAGQKINPAAPKKPVSPIAQVWSFDSLGALQKKLKVCNDYITPACLQALYEIPAATSNVQNNPIGVVEYTPEFYSQSDLDLFFSNFSSHQKQTTPDVEDVDNVGLGSTANPSFGSSGEANLDLEYGK